MKADAIILGNCKLSPGSLALMPFDLADGRRLVSSMIS